MRITDVRTIMLAAPIPPERQWRHDAGTPTRHETTLIRVETDEGIVGIGEASGSPPVISSIVRHRLRPILLGQDPTRVEYLWELMYSGKRIELVLKYGSPYHCAQVHGGMLCAISGVDVALWDILGKSLGLPLHRLLGGGVRDRVPAYGSGGWAGPDAAADEARGYVSRGFRAIKIRVGGIDDEDFPARSVLRVERIREAVGPDIEIMVDAHGALTVAQATALAERIKPLDVAWFEEPVTVADDLAGLAEVRSRTTIPIATGEHEQTRFAFQPILRARAADVLQPDIAIAGGLTEARRIAVLAHTDGVVVNPHSWGSAVLHAASAHFALATANCTRLELSQGYNPLLTDLITTDVAVEPDGCLRPPPGPGLGVELQPDIEQRYPYEEDR